ncbi:MAG: hypothetical protein N2508_01760 [Anaerolineae bacterium]|nr:hypothetical protein [Anaerolineae bacterium]
MPVQRKTQNPEYWEKEFTVTSEDLQYLSNLLVEDELPRSTEELAGALIVQRCREEDAMIKRALAQGTLYRPRNSYVVGERVVFPLLDYRVGEVVGIRPGRNPEYGPFSVIQVKFDKGRVREFAAEFLADHPLNRENGNATENLLSPDELVAIYSARVGKLLEERLESEPDFVRLGGKWFRRDLLVEIHAGHLNLVEAMLDMAGGGPLPTEALLGDLELPNEISPQLRLFSLNYALQEDERFDEVGPAGEILWFLRSMEPAAVRSVPPHLRYRPEKYEHRLLTSEMLALEKDLDDEWSDLEPPATVTEPVTYVLTYPHRISGTLPLSSRLSRIFPTGRTQRIRFTLVDADTGMEMPAWVVREGRYVYGLEEWYETYHVPVGAYIELMHGEQPGIVKLRLQNRRPRREWIRVALPVEGRLTFEMRKQMIPCAYDELMILAGEDSAAMEAVWARVQRERISLKQLIAEIFPELAKLSPQGTVHAATLYSAVNVALRTPPGPMLAELVSSGLYSPVGDNYWVLRGKV